MPQRGSWPVSYTESLDAISYVFACGTVLAISAIATFVPARRAARVDPLVVLRMD